MRRARKSAFAFKLHVYAYDQHVGRASLSCGLNYVYGRPVWPCLFLHIVSWCFRSASRLFRGFPYSGNGQSGVRYCTATFPQFSEIGAWKVWHVYLADKGNNSKTWFTDELKALGLPTTLQVQGSSSDAKPPSLLSAPDT